MIADAPTSLDLWWEMQEIADGITCSYQDLYATCHALGARIMKGEITDKVFIQGYLSRLLEYIRYHYAFLSLYRQVGSWLQKNCSDIIISSHLLDGRWLEFPWESAPNQSSDYVSGWYQGMETGLSYIPAILASCEGRDLGDKQNIPEDLFHDKRT